MKITTLDREKRNVLEEFSPSNEAMKSIEIVTKYTNTLGKCYSVRPKPDIVKLGILDITIIAHMDIYIYLAHPGQFMYNTWARVSVKLMYDKSCAAINLPDIID